MLKKKKLNFIFAAVLSDMASPDERQSLYHGADKQSFVSSSSAGADLRQGLCQHADKQGFIGIRAYSIGK